MPEYEEAKRRELEAVLMFKVYQEVTRVGFLKSKGFMLLTLTGYYLQYM